MADASLLSYCRVRVSATTFSNPGTWAMFVANSLMNANWCLSRFETGVAGLKESAHQRFLIREYSEAPSFEHVPKLEDCGVDRHEFQVVGRVAGFGGHCSSTENPSG